MSCHLFSLLSVISPALSPPFPVTLWWLVLLGVGVWAWWVGSRPRSLRAHILPPSQGPGSEAC